MFAFGEKRDFASTSKNVRFRPKADIPLAVRYWGNADIADMSECKAANIRRLN